MLQEFSERLSAMGIYEFYMKLRQVLDFLRNLLKDQPYVALVYMTGILPVKKYGSHSALNMFAEYSMTDQDIFEKYTGFTEDALKIYMDMDFDGLRADVVQMLGGGRVRVNTRSFQNDMQTFRTKDDVLTLLIHLGYLAYDFESREAFIPNKEIIEELENAILHKTGGDSRTQVRQGSPIGHKPDQGKAVSAGVGRLQRRDRACGCEL